MALQAIPVPATRGFDEQAFTTPQHTQKGRKDTMGRIHKKDHPLPRLGFCQARLKLLSLAGCLGREIRFGRSLTDFVGFHPYGCEELPHLGRAPLEARQLGTPLCRFGHAGWRVLTKVRDNEGTVVSQRAVASMKGHLFELFDTTFTVHVQVAVQRRCGKDAQATDVGWRYALTHEVEDLHLALYPRMWVVQSPVMQRFPLSCGKLHPIHWRAS